MIKKGASDFRNLINEQITAPEVLLVVPEGENQKLPLEKALEMAREQTLDLVQITDKQDIPVVKLLNYKKYIYKLQKVEKTSKSSNGAGNRVKSIVIKPLIGDNDIMWKAEKALEWLKAGNRVQLVVKAFGRMKTREGMVFDIANKFLKMVEGHCKLLAPLKRTNGNQYEAHLLPLPRK